MVSVFALDFSCSGKSESLFGTGISLYLWHFYFNELVVNLPRHRVPTVSIFVVLPGGERLFLSVFFGSGGLGGCVGFGSFLFGGFGLEG